MNAILSMGANEWWQLAGWTMLHFLWLGTLVGAAAMVARLVLRRASSSVRYSAALLCFACVSLTPLGIAAWLVVTSNQLFESIDAVEIDSTSVAQGASPTAAITPSAPGSIKRPTVASPQISPASNLPDDANPRLSRAPSIPTTSSVGQLQAEIVLEACVRFLPWLWIVGAPLTFALLATGVVGAERLRRGSRIVDDGPLVDTCRRLAQTLRIGRRVTVAVCERIAAPVLVGVVRPIILLPPAALTGWSPDEIEMVLLHELAHVRRWDNLVNLAQRLVESLLFFHPAVWLISNWVRREREACCDAVVVDRTNRPHAYAEMLVALAARMPRSVLFHPAASSAMAAGPLHGRIRRILGIDDDPMLVSGKSLAMVMSGLLLAATLVVLNLPTQSRAGESAAEDAEHAEKKPDRRASRPAMGFTVFHGVPFEVGASRFADEDAITITSVEGTSTTFEPDNFYLIKGTYTLASRDRASLGAFVTARKAEEGRSVTSTNQTLTVNRGSGTFVLEMPMNVRGWPHVSFYPAEGGQSFGGVYFGTGDSTLKFWRDVHDSNYPQWSESDVARGADELVDPRSASSPSPTERFIARRAFKTLGIRLVPATSEELKAVNRNRSAGLKVVEGTPPLSPGVKTVVLGAIHGSEVRTLDDVDRILETFDKWEDPINIYCLTEADGVPGNLQFQVVPRDPRASEVAVDPTPIETAARKFPSLEDQRLADMAYKRLGLELEPIGEDDRNRVNAMGFDSGVLVTQNSGAHISWEARGVMPNDILVGLHVWPTTNLKEVINVIGRQDLAELNPLKFYLVRNDSSQGFSGRESKDVIVTRRFSVPIVPVIADPSLPKSKPSNELALQRQFLPGDAPSSQSRPEGIPDDELFGPKQDSTQAGMTGAPTEGDLRYEGGTFDEWRNAWRTELSTEKRLEAVKALAAFGASGYGKEAAEAIMEVAPQYGPSMISGLSGPIEGDSNSNRELLRAIVDVMGGLSSDISPYQIPLDDKLTVIMKAAKSDDSQQRIAAAVFLSRFPSHKGAMNTLFELTYDEDQRVRGWAYFLHRAITNSPQGVIDHLKEVIEKAASAEIADRAKDALQSIEKSLEDEEASRDAVRGSSKSP